MKREFADAYLVQVGRRIKMARRAVPLTQAQLAARSGIDRSYLGQVERGTSNLGLAALLAIGQALDLNPASLLPTLKVESDPEDPPLPSVGPSPEEALLKARELLLRGAKSVEVYREPAGAVNGFWRSTRFGVRVT